MIATTARKTESTPQAVQFVADGRDGECCVNVPTSAFTLAGFRAWSSSDEFPETGKITFIGGEILIDMSPERLVSHVAVKSEVCRVAANVAAIKKKGGWQESKVFGKQFRLLRIKDRLGNVAYRLEVK